MGINFCIATTCFANLLRANLEKELSLLETDGVKIKILESSIENTTLLFCRLEPNGDIYSEQEWRLILNNIIASVVSENIISCWEKNILQRIIYENYYYLSPDELSLIKNNALSRLNDNETPSNPVNFVNKLFFKNVVYSRLLNFLNESVLLNIEGFIAFRLKDYINILNDTIDEAVEDYLLEKEYIEFIDLLRSVTGLHEIENEEVHVVFKTERCVKLLDESLHPIKCDYFDNLLGDSFENEEIIYDDLLICVLIAISPRKIILHYHSEMHPPVLNTIKKVFPARVRECKGCFLSCQF